MAKSGRATARGGRRGGAKNKHKTRPPKPRYSQPHLPGAADKKLKEIEDAAQEYKEFRDDRMKAQKPETEAQKNLLAIMDKHGVTEHRFNGEVAFIEEGKRAARVRAIKEKKPTRKK